MGLERQTTSKPKGMPSLLSPGRPGADAETSKPCPASAGPAHARPSVSAFGGFDIHRYVYDTRETQKHQMIPLDAILALPQSEFSYVLQDLDQMALPSCRPSHRPDMERPLSTVSWLCFFFVSVLSGAALGQAVPTLNLV